MKKIEIYGYKTDDCEKFFTKKETAENEVFVNDAELITIEVTPKVYANMVKAGVLIVKSETEEQEQEQEQEPEPEQFEKSTALEIRPDEFEQFRVQQLELIAALKELKAENERLRKSKLTVDQAKQLYDKIEY